MKCSACKIIAHASCISVLMERSQLACKPTFRDVGVRQYREQTRTHHHWIHRRTEKGKCRQCGKVSNVIHAVIDLNCTLSMSNYPHGALSKFVVTQRQKKNGKTVFQFEYSWGFDCHRSFLLLYNVNENWQWISTVCKFMVGLHKRGCSFVKFHDKTFLKTNLTFYC